MPHAALCVSRQLFRILAIMRKVFQCRTQHCVCRDHTKHSDYSPYTMFQCRTQHCVCRDFTARLGSGFIPEFQCRTQHCVCRDHCYGLLAHTNRGFNAARSIVCVETRSIAVQHRRRDCFNAARSIVCVETLCPAALVPRGLRRHFGKTRFFAPFLASADELCPEKWGRHRRCPLCSAGCTVLERRNGGMRLCARAGALSISFSSYLMIAHASFFFNDVFASIQRGR